MRSSSSPIPFSPMTYTLLPVSLNLVCSRYAAAAKDELKISSGWTSRPKDVNFDLYPALLLVELLVTKKSLLPRACRSQAGEHAGDARDYAVPAPDDAVAIENENVDSGKELRWLGESSCLLHARRGAREAEVVGHRP
mmetsp:Transcript_93379/g.302259  ORF Transcript_93379/g.302259 Transcript_93379/m.302259 type:complete len:138 (-) Transcript_93379:225-638(-)